MNILTEDLKMMLAFDEVEELTSGCIGIELIVESHEGMYVDNIIDISIIKWKEDSLVIDELYATMNCTNEDYGVALLKMRNMANKLAEELIDNGAFAIGVSIH